jgi:hypothetical protein
MTLFSEPNNIAIIIQLAVAPVFLLAGIAGFLAVMSGRLGRIIDRERVISRRLAKLADPTTAFESHQEHHVLMKRAFITNRAIGLCTYSALTVCTLITALFIDDIFDLGLAMLVALLFILTMLFLIIALIFFLLEIRLATRTLNLAREVDDED